jgi:hypothetical protein
VFDEEENYGHDYRLRSEGQGRGLMTGRGYGPIGAPVGRKQFLGLGALLISNSILRTGQPYTFTYAHGRIFEYNSQEWVQSQLAPLVSDLGSVYGVERPFFSDHYVITVVPSIDESLETWQGLFDYAWRQMGYNSATFVRAEGGTESTQPGGFEQVLPQVGEISVSALKPILPYALVFLGIYVAITMLPTMMARRR